jgi:hypothetical protein
MCYYNVRSNLQIHNAQIHNVQIYNVQPVCKTEQCGYDFTEGAFKCRVGSFTRRLAALARLAHSLNATPKHNTHAQLTNRNILYRNNESACLHGQVALVLWPISVLRQARLSETNSTSPFRLHAINIIIYPVTSSQAPGACRGRSNWSREACREGSGRVYREGKDRREVIPTPLLWLHLVWPHNSDKGCTIIKWWVIR